MILRLILIFFILASNEFAATAQFSMPITTTIRTPGGNVPYTYYTPSPRYYYGQPNVSVKYRFDVVLKNDSTFSARTKINIEDKKNHSISIKDGKNKKTFFPADTKSISRTSISTGHVFVGIPADTCWLFKTYSGKINGYSFVAEPGLLYVIAVQLGKRGPIVPLTKENLLSIMNTEDPAILKLIEKDRFVRAIEKYNAKKE